MSDLGVLDLFPKDIILIILGFLDKRSLCEFSLACRKARELMLIGLSKTVWMDRFMIRAYNRRYDLFLELLSEWRNPGYWSNYVIRQASTDGRVELVKLLLADKRVDPTAVGNYAIQWASHGGCLGVVKLLLADKRVDPAANNCAIKWASENGYLEVVRLLVEDPRVNPTAGDNYAIKKAFQNGHFEIVKLLQERGCKL